MLENIVLFVLSASQQKTFSGFVSVCMLWVKTHVGSSLSEEILKMLHSQFLWNMKTRLSHVDGAVYSAAEVGKMEQKTDWGELLSRIKGSWSVMRENPLFAKVCNVINYVVTIGLCSASSVTFHMNDYVLYAPEILKKQITCLSVFDACAELILSFSEVLYSCFANRSLTPLILGRKMSDSRDMDFLNLKRDFTKFKNGNMSGDELMTSKASLNLDIDNRIKSLLHKYKDDVVTLKGLERKVVSDRISTLLAMEVEIYEMSLSAGLRHAPWAVEVFGPSNQGKTTFTDQLVTYILGANNMDTDHSRRCTINLDDKYMSTWSSDKLVMNIDDLGNTHSNFVTESPTRKVIDFINNAPVYAVKAEIEAKGRCLVMPWVVTATTNVKDLNAGVYSVHPISVQRRFICMTVHVKREFAIFDRKGNIIGVDSHKVVEKFGCDSLLTDIWDITVERAIPSQRGPKATADYEPIVWKPSETGGSIELTNVSIETVAMWAAEDFGVHIMQQRKIVKSANAGGVRFVKCPSPGCIHSAEVCRRSEFHCSERRAFSSAVITEREPVQSTEREHIHETEDLVSPQYDEAVRFLAESVVDLDWVYYIMGRMGFSESLSTYQSWIYTFCVMKPMVERFGSIFALFFLLSCIVSVMFWSSFRVSICWHLFCLTCVLCFHIFIYIVAVHAVANKVRVLSRDLPLTRVVSHFLTRNATTCATILFGSVAFIYAIKSWRRINKEVFQSTGNLTPRDLADIEERDKERNVYAQVRRKALPLTEVSRTTDSTRLLNTLRKNLCHCEIDISDNKVERANVLFLKTGVLLLPAHYFVEDEMDAEFSQPHLGHAHTFRAVISLSRSYVFPDKDLCICYISSGGEFKDITSYCLTEEVESCVPFVFNKLMKTGDLLELKGKMTPTVFQTDKVMSSRGAQYSNFDSEGVVGDCGSILVSDGIGSALLGIHVAAIRNTKGGFCVTLTQGDIAQAVESMASRNPLISHADVGTFEKTSLGITCVTPQELHFKSPLNYMPPNSSISYYGSCTGRATFCSRVSVTPLSQYIINVCGVENIYRGPIERPAWKPWQDCLQNMAVPAKGICGNILNWCVADYIKPLQQLVDQSPDIIYGVLTDTENMVGVPGKRFLDAIKIDTSAGYPFVGKKSAYLGVNEVNAAGRLDRQFEPRLQAWITSKEEILANGQRCYFIAKACRKDEVVNKDKGRIFFSSNVGLIYLIRKYFLGISRFLQLHPLLSECAVGINAEGPEWHQMHEHVTFFGENTIIAGDYKKYDQKLPSQLIEAAFVILIELARTSGKYSERDLRVMNSLATEVMYSYIAYDGSLISISEGTHVSGNPLTVIINSIVGSLNMRYAFTSIYQDPPSFRSVVKLITYGDDNIGGVHPCFGEFNIENIAGVLGERGQILTMPDKSENFRPYLRADELEFLKRRSEYLPNGCIVGKLEEASIFKRLHCVLREKNSPLSMRELCAVNIDSAIRDWFFHGRELYELRLSQMKEVAKLADLSHMCDNLDRTYDSWLDEWSENYNEQLESMLASKAKQIQGGEDASSREYNQSPQTFTGYELCQARGTYTLERPDRVLQLRFLMGREEDGSNKRSNKQTTNKQNYFGFSNWVNPWSNTNPSANVISDNKSQNNEIYSTADVQMKYSESSSQNRGLVEFDDAEPNAMVDVSGSLDLLFDEQRMSHTNFDEFFKERFVTIRSIDWGTGVNLADSFNPWREYCTNPVVASKLQYFNLLRGKLELKFMINGNSTFWGEVRMYYTPYFLMDQGAQPSTLAPADIVETSKRPHVELQPNDSNGASMLLPFFWHKDYLHIPSAEWNDMGEISSYTIAPLAQSNAQVDTVTITVMARLVDAEIHGVTSQIVSTSEMATKPSAKSPEMWYDEFAAMLHKHSLRLLDDDSTLVTCSGGSTNKCAGSPTRVASQWIVMHKTNKGSEKVDNLVSETRTDWNCPFTSKKTLDELDAMLTDDYAGSKVHVHVELRKNVRIWLGTKPSYFLKVTWKRWSVLESDASNSYDAFSTSEIDEANKNGVISGVATNVAKAAGVVAKISSKMGFTMFTPYAIATQLGASSVAGMARLFGYSKPVITRAPEDYHPRVIGNIATTTTPDNTCKLTVDDKQELSIDPATVGLHNSDNMLISNWARRETTFDVFDWSPADAAGQLLFNTRVTPGIFRESGPPADLSFHLTSLCEAMLPFKYWTGTLNFRFSVICSGFHVGRLLIKYDPNIAEDFNPATGKCQVLDIQAKENRICCFSIKNNQPQALLESYRPGIDGETEVFGTNPIITSDLVRANGVLSVFVLNRLTLLQSTADNSVKVKVSVSAGDDFAVYNPDDFISAFEPEAFSTSEIEDKEVCNDSGASNGRNPNFEKVYIGERVISLRPMLKRYTQHRRDMLATSREISNFYFRRNLMPLVRGAVPGAVDVGNVNVVNMVLPVYVALAHAGWKGSMRYKMLFQGNLVNWPSATALRPAGGVLADTTVVVERGEPGQDSAFNNGRLETILGSVKQIAEAGSYSPFPSTGSPTLHKGGTYADSKINPTVSIEAPFYSVYKFHPGRRLDYASSNPYVGGFTGVATSSWVEDVSYVDTLVAAGEDFTPLFYVGLPPMKYRPVFL